MNTRKHKFYLVHRCLNYFARWIVTGVLSKFFRVAFTIGGIITAAFLTFIQLCEPNDGNIPLPFREIANWIHDRKFAIALWLLGIETTCGFFASFLRMMSEWKTPSVSKIERVLAGLVEQHFNHRDVAHHVYRATLFREIRFWPFGRWLGIVSRSSRAYSKSNTVFSISLDSRFHNTGIAGECWWRANSGQGGEFFTVIPDCRNKNDSTAENEYNRRGHLDQKELQNVSVRSCFFRAVAIRRRGEVWGVLVIDSTDSTDAPQDEGRTDTRANNRQRAVIVQAAETISLLIE